MMHGSCRCFHHLVTKLLIVFAWLSAVAFWWAGWKGMMILGRDTTHWFQDVVILSLLALGTVFCGCCGKAKMVDNICKHEMGCTCGDCERCR